MKGSHLVLLVSASVIAVAVLLAPRPIHHVPEPSCGESGSCIVGAESSDPAGRGVESAPPSKPAGSAVEEPPAPADGAALRDEADRLIHEGKVREGLDIFRKAVEAEPTAKNHGDLGELLCKLTAFDEAAVHLRAAAELDPGNADRWIALANLYYRKVDLGEAWKAEQRAREAEPGLQLARDAEGLRVRKGDSTRAVP